MRYCFVVLIVVLFILTACSQNNGILTTSVSVDTVTTTPRIMPIVSDWQSPLDKITERVTKKFFGTKVSPTDSPVQPERFSGYHTAVDFETFPDEADIVITVKAACSGKIIQSRTASGYGGVVVQSCMYHDEPVTVIYGHVDITSVTIKVGEIVNVGQTLGNLGKGYSQQTDGERKHLHFGIHKGSTVSILGYVSKQSDLSNWIDPLTILNT